MGKTAHVHVMLRKDLVKSKLRDLVALCRARLGADVTPTQAVMWAIEYTHAREIAGEDDGPRVPDDHRLAHAVMDHAGAKEL